MKNVQCQKNMKYSLNSAMKDFNNTEWDSSMCIMNLEGKLHDLKKALLYAQDELEAVQILIANNTELEDNVKKVSIFFHLFLRQ